MDGWMPGRGYRDPIIGLTGANAHIEHSRPNLQGRAGNKGGRGRGSGRGVPLEDEVSQHWDNQGGDPQAGAGRGAGVPHAQNQFARDLLAALTAANLLNQAPRENVEDRVMVATREFSRRNPPVFEGTSSDP
ncbi:hypothetical protein RHMOL_Rhmol11G0041100 [Rhododendron molle]|uniref:Uncharacterized protein n=1 Tax=Rhododendron molle TaxID=49168 RepID=A0ACC0LPZ4_RHOML|nr:hypothetical protein RHMOL_Rhmol11G0041100 [Rhododendron molle]